jgi:hypothetical protein
LLPIRNLHLSETMVSLTYENTLLSFIWLVYMTVLLIKTLYASLSKKSVLYSTAMVLIVIRVDTS